MRSTPIFVVMIVLWAATAAAADSTVAARDRAGWLLERTVSETPTLQRAALPQSDIGGTRLSSSPADVGHGSLRPMLYSLLVPGLGEASLGYKRGYAMMALDVATWIGVKHYHDLGNQKREDFYDYLDTHWSEARLSAAFGDDTGDEAGTFYYQVLDYTELSLWVSKEVDEREYYENAGKWDQFVFGWDDFIDPRGQSNWWQDTDPTWDDPTDLDTRILKDVRVSAHREAYRALRQESNEAFNDRDTLVYLNMFTRVFSMVQVAYLQGVFSGGGSTAMNVAGHDLALIAEPRGLTSSRLGVSISY
jgi:hypothetical protein